MQQPHKQTINFNLNSVPIQLTLSSKQPLPENLAETAVRALVRNAASTDASQPGPAGSTDSTPTPPSNTATPVDPPTPSSPTANITAPIFIPANNTQQQQQQQPAAPISFQQYIASNTQSKDQLRAWALCIVVIATKHLFTAHWLDALVLYALSVSFGGTSNILKNAGRSQQIFRSKTDVNTSIGFLAVTLCALALSLWLFSCQNIFNLMIFNIEPESWTFESLVAVGLWLLIINHFIKCCLNLLKISACLVLNALKLPASVPIALNIMNFVDVFGHIYLTLVVETFWLVYLYDVPYGIGIVVFFGYLVRRLPYFTTLIKFARQVFPKLFHVRTYGRCPTKDEIRQAEQCAICMQEEFRLPTVVSCSHVFCHSCIVGWLSEKPNCPVCRQYIQTGLEGINFETELQKEFFL